MQEQPQHNETTKALLALQALKEAGNIKALYTIAINAHDKITSLEIENINKNKK